jgi:hypothetical protein
MTTTGLYINSNSSFLHKNGELSVTKEAIIKSNSFTSNGSGYIDINGGRFEAYTSDVFQIDNNKEIRNIGTGIVEIKKLLITNGHMKLSSGNTMNSLKIFVDEDFIMGSGSSINKDGDPKQVALYYRGTTEGNSQKVVDISADSLS